MASWRWHGGSGAGGSRIALASMASPDVNMVWRNADRGVSAWHARKMASANQWRKRKACSENKSGSASIGIAKIIIWHGIIKRKNAAKQSMASAYLRLAAAGESVESYRGASVWRNQYIGGCAERNHASNGGWRKLGAIIGNNRRRKRAASAWLS